MGVQQTSDDTATPRKSDVAVQDGPVKTDGLDGVRQQAHGPQKPGDGTTGTASDTRPNTTEGGAGGDGFAIVGTDTSKPEKADIKVLPSLKPAFDAEKVADEIEDACNGGWTGIGTNRTRIVNALTGLNPEQIAQVDQKFADKHGIKYAARGQRWGLREEFKDEMSGASLERNLAILDQKNEIPAERRIAGADLLKEGSGLTVGETNRVVLADGRKYDVYIPHNAQKPLPVMLVMHGASNAQDTSEMRIMEKETGMNFVAEQYGFAVVYAYNEPRPATDILGRAQQPAVWNLQGNKNLMATDPKYDDAKYLDRVIADVGNRAATDETRIGIAGMSDGGRAAEQYALDRPGKISSVISMQGTWMDGNRKPEAGNGLPIMIVKAEVDHMLPNSQGEDGMLWGKKGRGMMSWIASSVIPGTADSRPAQQMGVFKDANQCTGDATKSTLHNLEITEFKAEQCQKGPIKEVMIKGANHAWHDWRNAGGWYVVGMPDRTQNMSEESAKFILSHPLRRSF